VRCHPEADPEQFFCAREQIERPNSVESAREQLLGDSLDRENFGKPWLQSERLCCAGAARFPGIKNKSRRVIPVPIRVRLMRKAARDH
jgi:hypothetical protein